MNHKRTWLVLLGLYFAAIWIDVTGRPAGLTPPMYILAGVAACWLPSRSGLLAMIVIGITSLITALIGTTDSPALGSAITITCLVALFVTRWRIEFPIADAFSESDTVSASSMDSFVVNTVTKVVSSDSKDVDTEFLQQSDDSLLPRHETRIHETHHRYRRESGTFALDARATRDYVGPALERLYASGRFDDGQMKMIATEMRVLEEHGLVADFVSCLSSGTQVGRFVIDEPLGRGGEGNVYRGHDESGQPAAIKILHNMRVSDRFRREMHLVRQLAHPNIVTAYEVGEFRGLPFITMELLAGPDLYVRVKESGPINWQPATQYILQAARALAHAHQRNLIHRDIKPGNMILNSESTIKLVDFGLAAEGNASANSDDSVFRYRTEDGHLAGTLPFMAPEQARSLANADPRSDIYGLGATWFYLLTGLERLRGKTFAQQFENLLVHRKFNALNESCMPQPLVEIYRRMVHYDAGERFESCEMLCDEIETALREAGRLVIPDKINVLVIEDSRTDMLFTIEMLRRSNSTLNIHQARSLSAGIEACDQEEMGLVLLDLSLPDSNGVETVSRFREAIPGVPLVVLSGMAEDDVCSSCLNAGAESFVSKHGLTAHRMERTIFVTLSRHDQIRRRTGSPL